MNARRKTRFAYGILSAAFALSLLFVGLDAWGLFRIYDVLGSAGNEWVGDVNRMQLRSGLIENTAEMRQVVLHGVSGLRMSPWLAIIFLPLFISIVACLPDWGLLRKWRVQVLMAVILLATVCQNGLWYALVFTAQWAVPLGIMGPHRSI